MTPHATSLLPKALDTKSRQPIQRGSSVEYNELALDPPLQGSSLSLKQEQAANLVQSVLKVLAIHHDHALDTIDPCIHSQGLSSLTQEPASSNPVLICVVVGGDIQVVSQHTRSGSQISK